MSMVGVGPQLSAPPGSIGRSARWSIGSDTDEVLWELWVGADRQARLRDESVIA